MSQFYLLNAITVGAAGQPTGLGVKYLPGKLIDTSVVPASVVTAIQAAGGVLWPAADAVVAAAATVVQARIKNRGINEDDGQSIMLAAASNSILAGGVAAAIQHVQTLLSLASIQAQTSGTAFNVGAALPANARLIDANVNVLTALSGGGATAVTATLQGGSDASGSIIASHSVWTGANPVNSPIGSNPYPSRGGQQLKMTLTSTGATLAALTAGSLSVDVFYATVP